MTTKTPSHDGHGGAYVVTDVEVKKSHGTLNPGDPGYREAFEKAPVESRDKSGTLNRLPSFRELEERPAKPAATPAKAPAIPAPATPDKGGK